MKPMFKLAAIAILGSLFAPALLAQTAKPASKQEIARRAFSEVTERMQKLQVRLADTDPDKARILGIGTKFIQEKKIKERMDSVQTLLEEENWDEALGECKTVLKDIDKLIELLLKGDSRIEDLIKEIQRLEAFKNRVDKLIKEQQKEKEDSAKAEALEKHLKDIEKAKQDLDKLIQDQKDLRNKTNDQAFSAKPDQNQKSADKEGELKDQAGKMADALKKLEKDSKELKDPKGGGAGGKGDGKGEGEGEGKGGGEGGGEGGGKGSGAAAGAQQDMGGAQNKLQDNQPKGSLEDMDKALDKLQKAKDELDKMEEEAKRQLKSLPFEQLAKKQNVTKVDTDRLAKDMEKSEQGEDGESSGPTPGKQNVQQAVPKQKSAAGSLKEKKPSKAKQDQQDAQDDLEEAKRALEEALAQLRQQLQDEVLRSLEERFAEMLTKQKKITANTKVIHRLTKEALTADGGMPASLRERTDKQATGEFGLAGDANDALKLLEEEGTTAVFPDFIEELEGDLKRVGKRLQKHRTGSATQAAQKEIEEMLKMLIDALRKAIEENDKKGGEP